MLAIVGWLIAVLCGALLLCFLCATAFISLQDVFQQPEAEQ
jgi:hypothetical protein